MCELFACMYVCVAHMGLVHTEARRDCQIPWTHVIGGCKQPQRAGTSIWVPGIQHIKSLQQKLQISFLIFLQTSSLTHVADAHVKAHTTRQNTTEQKRKAEKNWVTQTKIPWQSRMKLKTNLVSACCMAHIRVPKHRRSSSKSDALRYCPSVNLEGL